MSKNDFGMTEKEYLEYLQRQEEINARKKYNTAFDRQSRSGSLAAKIGAVRESKSTFDWAKPILIGAFVFFLIIGPGVSAILAIAKSMNIFIWIGLIILGLLIWRNR